MRKAISVCICLFIGQTLVHAQLPAGWVALYPFNNSAGDISGNGYSGTLISTSSDINRLGAAGNAIAFIAGTSSGTLPSGLVTALANDFTVGYWVKTTMSAPSSTQWYGGVALVDAEVCGGTSDWGTALINGGQIALGIGNPDLTIISPLSYNDGNWHFVTATRAQTAGVITLYVDGTQVASTSGTSTAARTAPPLIGLGRNPCVASGVFTGSLDDMIAYNSVLTPTQVSNLYTYYTAQPLPVHWGSFTGAVQSGQAFLKWTTENSSNNARFEIQRSADAGNFSKIGDVSAGAAIDGPASSLAYHFIDVNPLKGQNYYRVRGIDADGSISYTAILELTLSNGYAPIRLQSNPVSDKLTLINKDGLMIARLQVLDVTGKILFDQATQSGNSRVDMDIATLKAGYYLLKIIAAGKTVTIGFLKL